MTNKSSNLTIENKDIELFAEIAHKNFESKLYAATRSLKVPVYATDAFGEILNSKEIDLIGTIEKHVIISDDPSECPKPPYHDTVLYINYDRSFDTIASLDIRLLWAGKNDCGLDLISIAPIYTTPYFTSIPIGYIKSVDIKYIYTPEEEKLFKYIALHTLYAYADPRGFTEFFKYRGEPEKFELKK